ncbi:MAG: nitrophenyl compound nitroreductase subunit ArsF family protein [Phycisphaerae bacterium]
MKAKKTIAKVLIAFLLVSIGVAIGKEMAARNAPSAVEPVTAAGETKIVVYYFHGVPCVTCTFIETTAEKLVREEFAEAVEAGTMEFVSLNYLEPENVALADKYNVGENMVVAVRFEDGKEVSRVRLDEVMELASNADRLRDYLRKGVRSAVEGGNE